jgi:hypothetical protein
MIAEPAPDVDHVFSLTQVEQAIRESWGEDTSHPREGERWTRENPSLGQCDVTCLVVNDLLGGELAAADVYLDGERVEGHMWNRLPCGLEVDLTREQFRQGEIVGEPRFRPRPERFDPAHPRYHRYETYLVLARRVRERLGLSA